MQRRPQAVISMNMALSRSAWISVLLSAIVSMTLFTCFLVMWSFVCSRLMCRPWMLSATLGYSSLDAVNLKNILTAVKYSWTVDAA